MFGALKPPSQKASQAIDESLVGVPASLLRLVKEYAVEWYEDLVSDQLAEKHRKREGMRLSVLCLFDLAHYYPNGMYVVKSRIFEASSQAAMTLLEDWITAERKAGVDLRPALLRRGAAFLGNGTIDFAWIFDEAFTPCIQATKVDGSTDSRPNFIVSFEGMHPCKKHELIPDTPFVWLTGLHWRHDHAAFRGEGPSLHRCKPAAYVFDPESNSHEGARCGRQR